MTILSATKLLDAQVPLPDDEAAKAESKPERLAIGGDGGFQVASYPMFSPERPVSHDCMTETVLLAG